MNKQKTESHNFILIRYSYNYPQEEKKYESSISNVEKYWKQGLPCNNAMIETITGKQYYTITWSGRKEKTYVSDCKCLLNSKYFDKKTIHMENTEKHDRVSDKQLNRSEMAVNK